MHKLSCIILVKNTQHSYIFIFLTTALLVVSALTPYT